MEIVLHHNPAELVQYLAYVKASLHEWVLVNVKLSDASDKNFTVHEAASLVHSLFKDREGKIYVSSSGEMLMLIRGGTNVTPATIAPTIESHLPAGKCEVCAAEPTLDGLTKLEILITCAKTQSLSEMRIARKENIALVADDDMYMRLLLKKGLGTHCVVHEVDNGAAITDAYKQHNPDIVFLDIHMPNMDGRAVLHELLTLDAKAYVIMLSADSSEENVVFANKTGAKGFLTKPFSKDRLVEYLQKCPTIS